MPHGDFLHQPSAVPLFWRGIGFMGAGFVCSWGLNRIPSLWFWVGAVVPRLILLAMHPGDDIWRYLWEGHIQLSGFNPYLLAPTADVLTPLTVGSGAGGGFIGWEFINHPDHAAIYPPITQLGFRALAAVAASIGTPVVLFKLSFVVADLFICRVLSRRFSTQSALLYAWNPLVIYSFAGGGHYDSWFLLPLVMAWLGWGKETLMTWKRAVAIGMSIAIKWMSLPVLAFLAWRRCQGAQLKNGHPLNPIGIGLALMGIGLLPLVLSAVPFCSGTSSWALSCPVLPLGSSFVNYGRSAAFVPHFVAMLWPSTERANWIYAIPLSIVLLWNFAKADSLRAFIERYFIALLLLSPIIHAWYFTWLMPFAVESRNFGARWVSLSAFVYFALPYGLALGAQQWSLTPFQHGLLWGPFVVSVVFNQLFGLLFWPLFSGSRSKNL